MPTPYELERQRLIANASNQIHQLAFDVYRYAGSNIASALGRAVIQVNKETAQTVKDLLQMFADNAIKEDAQVPGVMASVSVVAKNAMMERLDAFIVGPGSYREGDRESGGKLSEAAMTHAFIATRRGVRLLDRTKMNSAAKQWHRMNFGVIAGIGRNRAKPVNTLYEVHLSNVNLGGIGVTGVPTAPMLVPAGPWQGPSGHWYGADYGRRRRDKLMFRSTKVTKGIVHRRQGTGASQSGRKGFLKTRGIATADYIGAGSKALADALSVELVEMAKRISTVKGTPKSKVITVKA